MKKHTTTPTSKWLGTNGISNSYWDISPWADVGNNCCGFFATNNQPLPQFTANGYPIGTNISVRAMSYLGDCPVGEYNVTWTGNATINLRVSNGSWQQTSANTGIMTLTSVSNVAFGNPTGLLWLDVTSSDPTNPLDNLHIWLPGYGPGTPNANLMYRVEHTNILKTYAQNGIRMMVPLQVSSSQEINWSDRALTTNWGWSNQGCPHEACIQMAIEAGVNRCWVNVPIGASDDYVKQMAKLYHDNLPSNIELIVELSNEIWNWGGGFNGWPYVDTLANGNSYTLPNSTTTYAEFFNLTPSPWLYDGNIVNGVFTQTPEGGSYVTDSYTRAARCAGDRAAHVAKIFLAECADRPGMCSPVFGGQAAWDAWADCALSFLVARDGSHPFTYVAIAPYFGASSTDTTTDQIFAEISAWMNDDTAANDGLLYVLACYRTIASTYNVKIVCYEGGQSLWPNIPTGQSYNGTDIETQCQTDPRMGEAYTTYFSILQQGGIYAYFDFCAFGTWSQWGFWGTCQTFEDTKNPRYTAILAAANGSPLPPPPPQNVSIFGNQTPDANYQNVGDPSIPAKGVELGMKFTSSVAGKIVGIKFWKGSQNTGTHTGSIWTTAGARLVTATFKNETASGWQEILFTNPIEIKANTTYVVSYHTTAKYIAYTPQGLSNTIKVSPLTVTSLHNGVYIYGSTAYPKLNNGQSPNYWIDVIFST